MSRPVDGIAVVSKLIGRGYLSSDDRCASSTHGRKNNIIELTRSLVAPYAKVPMYLLNAMIR